MKFLEFLTMRLSFPAVLRAGNSVNSSYMSSTLKIRNMLFWMCGFNQALEQAVQASGRDTIPGGA